MPNASGVWTLSQQFQARGQGLWPAPPGAPTIGTATAGTSLCASVTFTAPACTGYPAGVTSYTVTSTPGCFTKTGASSPLVVTGLTNGTSYTFKVKATNASGLYSPCSAASNSITATQVTCATYTTAGTYSWVAPAGVTSVSMVAVGGGASGGAGSTYYAKGGGGGALAYKNNIAVTPGETLTITVGRGGASRTPSSGYWDAGVNSSIYRGGTEILTGRAALNNEGGQRYTTDGDGGGSGGYGVSSGAGGGGAGGYSGAGGDGSPSPNNSGASGSGGGGGGGGGSNITYISTFQYVWGGPGGGGTGILGQGTSGSGGIGGSGGNGGSGGSTGGSGTTTSAGTGGEYGGGGGGGGVRIHISSGASSYYDSGAGGGGAVRIIWPGTTRQFPSTNVGA